MVALVARDCANGSVPTIFRMALLANELANGCADGFKTTDLPQNVLPRADH